MGRVISIALAGLVVVTGVAAIAANRDGTDAPAGAAESMATATREPRSTERTSTSSTTTTRRTHHQGAGPTSTTERERRRRDRPDPVTCAATRRGAVIDRARQRAWLCKRGRVQHVFPVTTAVSQPEPGTYTVYAKEVQTTSGFGDRPSKLDRFVAFTYGKNTDARIGFHAIPRYFDGTLAQTPESVGSPQMFGDSSGCVRALPDDAVRIWELLAIGDEVRVIS